MADNIIKSEADFDNLKLDLFEDIGTKEEVKDIEDLDSVSLTQPPVVEKKPEPPKDKAKEEMKKELPKQNLDIVDLDDKPAKVEKKPAVIVVDSLGENIPYGGKFIEKLDMSLIATGKYVVRKTKRSDEDIQSLKDDIELHGQIEPMHVHKEGEMYHLLAGYGRFEAMSKLNSPTAKVICYENLDPSKIYIIANSSNQHRVEMSDWDKACSLGEFKEANPKIPVLGDHSLCSIFNYKKTMIYRLLEIYEMFIKLPSYKTALSEVKVPFFALDLVLENFDKIRNHENIIALIKRANSMARSEFKETMFNTLTEDLIHNTVTKAEEKENEETGEVADLSADELVSPTTKTKELKAKLENSDEKKKEVSDKFEKILESFKTTQNLLAEWFKNDGALKLVDKKLLVVFNKQVKEFNNQIASFSK